jgi:phage terminase large subunit
LSVVQIPDAFSQLFKPYRYKVFYGGRGGAKSWNFARALLVLGAQKPLRVLCTREFQNSIEDSVHRLLSDQIHTLGLDGFYAIKQREVVGANGTLFLFEGLHRNVHKVKSLEGIDICWVEEATKVTNESWEVLIPTIRKDGSEIWISFNPDQEEDPVYQRFVETPPPNSLVKKVGWRQNPYFPDTLKAELEWDRRVDNDKYQHIWEGNCRSFSEAQVFHGKWRIDVFTAPEDAVFYFGADWGFSQDPTVLVRCFIHDERLWIDYEAYGVGVDIDKTPELFGRVPESDRYIITADSARPETISYMQQHGYPRMRRSQKGKGSVEDGITFLRSFKEIVIHERCKHAADEFKLYSYKRDRLTGDILTDIEDKHNHCIDALRYAVEKVMLRNRVPQIAGIVRR